MSNKSRNWIGILFVIILIAPIVVAALLFFMGLLPYIFIGIGFSSRSSGTGTAADRGDYYRVTIQYLVDDVEPISFDVVAACNYDGFEALKHRFGMFPAVYGKRTRNNHAIVVTVPDFCGDVLTRDLGQIGGAFDGSFVPLTIWFDDASDLAVGLGYASVYSFENPSARLSFVKASVRYATREEFEDWYEFRNDNLVSSETVQPSLRMKAEFEGEKVLSFPGSCHGVGFVHGNDQARMILRKYWPEDHPKYWSEAQIGTTQWKEMKSELRKSDVAKFNMYDLEGGTDREMIKHVDWYIYDLSKGYSSLNRSKLGQYFNFVEKPTEQYPVYFYQPRSGANKGPGGSATFAKIDLRPEVKGFVACYASQYLSVADIRADSSIVAPATDDTGQSDQFRVDINSETVLAAKNQTDFGLHVFVEDRSIGRLIEIYTTKSGWIY